MSISREPHAPAATPRPSLLTIAGLPLRLAGERSLVDCVHARLDGWSGGRARSAPWTVRLQWTDQVKWPAGAGAREERSGAWSFWDERLRCEIDAKARLARASFVLACRAAGELSGALDVVLRNLILWNHLAAGGLALHASAVVCQGKAWVFVGPSGAGKTTAARLAREGAGAELLADDAVLLFVNGGGAFILPAPDWERPSSPVRPRAEPIPLAAILTLAKGKSLQVERLGPGAALAALTTRPPLEVISMEKVIDAAARVVACRPAVAICRLCFAVDPEAIKTLFSGMFRANSKSCG